jgi:DNA-binding MarR family transcriptional regulator
LIIKRIYFARVPYLLLKEVPRYECLQASAARVPGADPAICQLFLNILHTGDVVSRGEAAFLAGHGLNQARLIILILLDNSENGSLRSSELAEHASVRRATVTGLLDTLERAGLVQREPDPRDRRASSVKITSKGRTLLHKVQPLLIQWAEGILSALSAREQGQLVSLLKKTQKAFSEHHNKFYS